MLGTNTPENVHNGMLLLYCYNKALCLYIESLLYFDYTIMSTLAAADNESFLDLALKGVGLVDHTKRKERFIQHLPDLTRLHEIVNEAGTQTFSGVYLQLISHSIIFQMLYYSIPTEQRFSINNRLNQHGEDATSFDEFLRKTYMTLKDVQNLPLLRAFLLDAFFLYFADADMNIHCSSILDVNDAKGMDLINAIYNRLDKITIPINTPYNLYVQAKNTSTALKDTLHLLGIKYYVTAVVASNSKDGSKIYVLTRDNA
jgi:hypothetical protein